MVTNKTFPVIYNKRNHVLLVYKTLNLLPVIIHPDTKCLEYSCYLTIDQLPALCLEVLQSTLDMGHQCPHYSLKKTHIDNGRKRNWFIDRMDLTKGTLVRFLPH